MYDDSETESETDDMSTSQKSSPGSNSGSDDEEGGDDDEPEIRFAACSLLTSVGSFSDPADLPGLAHFLEHMLFVGTTQYPDENHYVSYVHKNGGLAVSSQRLYRSDSYELKLSDQVGNKYSYPAATYPAASYPARSFKPPSSSSSVSLVFSITISFCMALIFWPSPLTSSSTRLSTRLSTHTAVAALI